MFLLMAALTFTALSDVQPRTFPEGPAVRLIRSAAEWKDFAVETPQAIDFAKHSVVVVFAGERPSGGWSVKLTRIEKTGGSCKIDYEVKGPPRGAMVTQVFTHPYAVALVKGVCDSVSGPAGKTGIRM